MDRDVIKGNKLCYKKERERMKLIHKHNLQIAHPLIKTQMERLSQNQNKKIQLQEDRFTEIERENRILLEKIQNIMNHDKKRATSSWINTTSPSFKSTRQQSLNKEKRKQELVRITIENQKMMSRLTQKKPNYETRQILKQTQKQQQLVQQITEFPQKRSRIFSSSSKQKSCDLSKSSFQQPQKKIFLYKQTKIIDEQSYFIEVFYEDDLFKITADDQNQVKVFEMPFQDGQMVLSEIYNNNVLQLVDAIHIDTNIHLKGLEQFEEFQ